MTKEDRNKSFLLDAFNDYILEPSDDNLDLPIKWLQSIEMFGYSLQAINERRKILK